MHLKNQEAKTACMLPKLVGDRYPTSRYSVFAVKSVSGQICGQNFLPKHTAEEKRENARKTEILRAFGGRLMRRSHAPKQARC